MNSDLARRHIGGVVICVGDHWALCNMHQLGGAPNWQAPSTCDLSLKYRDEDAEKTRHGKSRSVDMAGVCKTVECKRKQIRNGPRGRQPTARKCNRVMLMLGRIHWDQ
jgi:hypothetical protein